MEAMLRGDFAAAWTISDEVLQRRTRAMPADTDRPRHLQAIWNGCAVDGKRVLVHCYHGLGDTLQFVRLLPLLRRRAREVILWAQPELIGLLASADGIDRIEALHDGAPDIERDVDIELMEIPHLLRLDTADVPARVPYLHLEDRRYAARTSRTLRHVGIAWRAGEWNPARSIPDSALAPLAGCGVRWLSLQYGVPALPMPAIDIACRDVREQAARMLSLDLVISVDTMVAHLAGALGLPVWTLLPRDCDWRWMSGRDDTPWYPTMRLFRQQDEHDWSCVIGDVCKALKTWRSMPIRERG